VIARVADTHVNAIPALGAMLHQAAQALPALLIKSVKTFPVLRTSPVDVILAND
jgi:hypothetical protein